MRGGLLTVWLIRFWRIDAVQPNLVPQKADVYPNGIAVAYSRHLADDSQRFPPCACVNISRRSQHDQERNKKPA